MVYGEVGGGGGGSWGKIWFWGEMNLLWGNFSRWEGDEQILAGRPGAKNPV